MRISDWSSDVCSSDLRRRLTVTPRLRRAQSAVVVAIAHHVRRRAERALIEYAHPVESVIGVARLLRVRPRQLRPVAVPVDRKSVVQGKSVSLRVGRGGRRIIKKKTPITTKSKNQFKN